MTDAEAIKQIMDDIKPRLPGYVVDVRYDLGNDWTGDPAVYVTVTLEDKVTGSYAALGRSTPPVRRLIFDSIMDSEVGRYPYVSFRSKSEHRNADARERRARASERKKHPV